jgi:hypothetical protein
MKTWNIEVQKVRAMAHGHGLIRAQIDAIVQPAAARDDAAPATVLSLSEDTARVLVLLLKTQLAELDSRKAKSRRG